MCIRTPPFARARPLGDGVRRRCGHGRASRSTAAGADARVGAAAGSSLGATRVQPPAVGASLRRGAAPPRGPRSAAARRRRGVGASLGGHGPGGYLARAGACSALGAPPAPPRDGPMPAAPPEPVRPERARSAPASAAGIACELRGPDERPRVTTSTSARLASATPAAAPIHIRLGASFPIPLAGGLALDSAASVTAEGSQSALDRPRSAPGSPSHPRSPAAARRPRTTRRSSASTSGVSVLTNELRRQGLDIIALRRRRRSVTATAPAATAPATAAWVRTGGLRRKRVQGQPELRHRGKPPLRIRMSARSTTASIPGARRAGGCWAGPDSPRRSPGTPPRRYPRGREACPSGTRRG